MKILIIEDEIKTQNFIKQGLLENGYDVDVACNGEEGFELAKINQYKLIILDVMLPQMDGWQIINELKQVKILTPILFLTARDSIEDRVKGLELGAYDYLIKPFAFSELLARIRVSLRKGNESEINVFKIADLEINLTRQKASRSGLSLDLTPKEFQLLSLLARRKGEVISRKSISELVWNINFDTGTNVIEVHMRRLRSKVDDPYQMKLIHTIRGIGYTLDEK